MRADREEGRICLLGGHGGGEIGHLLVQPDGDADVDQALHLGVQHVTGQPVFGDAEAHHPAGQGARLDDGDAVAQAAEMVGGGEPRWPGTDHQHVAAALDGRRGEPPALAQRLVAEEALDRVDADRLVDLRPIADAFAGMIADPAHDRRERVVPRQMPPGGLVVAAFSMVEPALDVLAGGALGVAGRQPVDIDRPLGAPGAGLVGE
jgi:hypothetical protein